MPDININLNITTTQVPEGTNLYYTQARFDAAFAVKDTDDLDEGGVNLYYTQARFDAAFSAKDTDDLAEGGTNLYYTVARFNTAFATKSTTDLAEGSSLYFTETRVRATLLTGLSVTNSAIVAGDNVLAGFGKTQGQLNQRPTGVSGTAGRMVKYTASGTIANSVVFAETDSSADYVTLIHNATIANATSIRGSGGMVRMDMGNNTTHQFVVTTDNHVYTTSYFVVTNDQINFTGGTGGSKNGIIVLKNDEVTIDVNGNDQTSDAAIYLTPTITKINSPDFSANLSFAGDLIVLASNSGFAATNLDQTEQFFYTNDTETKSFNNFIIGDGEVATDYKLTFDGSSNNGILTWKESGGILNLTKNSSTYFEYPGWNALLTVNEEIGNGSAFTAWLKPSSSGGFLSAFFGGIQDSGSAAFGSAYSVALTGYNYINGTNTRTHSLLIGSENTTEFGASCGNLTVPELIGTHTWAGSKFGGAGTVAVTNAYGLKIKDTSGFTPANNYGIYINSILNGTTDYAIYTNAGAVRFGDTVTGSDFIKSISPTAGIGYGTGSGGMVTQATSKATGVTLNKVCGQITMNNAALLGLASVFFTVTNSAVATTDVVSVCIDSGGTANAYVAEVVAVGAGSFAVRVTNTTVGSLSESPVINFAVIKSVTS